MLATSRFHYQHRIYCIIRLLLCIVRGRHTHFGIACQRGQNKLRSLSNRSVLDSCIVPRFCCYGRRLRVRANRQISQVISLPKECYNKQCLNSEKVSLLRSNKSGNKRYYCSSAYQRVFRLTSRQTLLARGF